MFMFLRPAQSNIQEKHHCPSCDGFLKLSFRRSAEPRHPGHAEHPCLWVN
jgi:hypothetical protein